MLPAIFAENQSAGEDPHDRIHLDRALLRPALASRAAGRASAEQPLPAEGWLVTQVDSASSRIPAVARTWRLRGCGHRWIVLPFHCCSESLSQQMDSNSS